MNSYIPYSPNAKAVAGASTRIVHTENVYTKGSVNNVYIDLTAADVMNAFSNDEIVFIIDHQSDANSKTNINLMTLENFHTIESAGKFSVTFTNGTKQYKFEATNTSDKLVLTQRA